MCELYRSTTKSPRILKGPSVLNQKFATFYQVVAGALYRQKRSIDLRMSSADFVHLKGLGSLLCLSMNDAISARSAVTLR